MITKEKKIWCEEEDAALKRLFEEEGEQSWSIVAKRLSAEYNFSRKSAKQCRERSDNCIKNHFYSKLRKILRKLNTVIHSHLRREYRQINIGTLYKIVEATEERFKEEPACGFSVSVACQGITLSIQKFRTGC
ncbi:uncharacterized protein LOC116245566 [Nymphaea colorata]|nr:uncharacterized protein LOC116245566 [Nymphaea colorata]